jgi:CHAD domain-containing protein
VGAIDAMQVGMQRMRAAMMAFMPARPQQGPQNGNGQ